MKLSLIVSLLRRKRFVHQEVKESAMRLNKLTAAILATALVAFSGSYVHAEEFFARLDGFQELGALNAQTGAILSDGRCPARVPIFQWIATVRKGPTISVKVHPVPPLRLVASTPPASRGPPDEQPA